MLQCDRSSQHSVGFMTHLWPLIGFCAASDKALLEQKDPQRLTGCHKGIDTEIKFQAIQQKRLVNVMRGYSVCKLNAFQCSF